MNSFLKKEKQCFCDYLNNLFDQNIFNEEFLLKKIYSIHFYENEDFYIEFLFFE